jgi:methylglyoxal synthase
VLAAHSLYSTGRTGRILASELGIDVINLESGPLGGDQQIGSRISEGKIDFLLFFWDPLEPQAHDPDVKALLRIAVVWNVPMACNRASADFVTSSALMSRTYDRLVPKRLVGSGAHGSKMGRQHSLTLWLTNGELFASALEFRSPGPGRRMRLAYVRGAADTSCNR